MNLAERIITLSQNNAVISENNVAIAENEPKVYNAGYEKGKSAFGVIGKETGTVVRADNVNENEHIVKVGLSSKNKFPYPYYSGMSRTENGVTFIANADGSITLNGTPTATAGYHLYMNRGSQKLIEKGKTYTLSLFNNPASKNEVYIGHNTSSNGTTWDGGTGAGTIGVTSKTFTVAQDYKGIQLYIVVTKNAGSLENVTVYPQLEEGTTATPYTPYVADVTSANVTANGKNLAPYPYQVKDKTVNGITFTDNGDGSIHISGIATGTAIYYLTKPTFNATPGDTFTLNMGTTCASNFYISLNYKDTSGADKKFIRLNSGTSITGGIPEDFAEFGTFFITVLSGRSIDVTVYPQLEVGSKATDWEPYSATQYTPNADGTLEIPPISPTMTLTTDKQGVNIECEYYQDGQAVIDELTNAIISLGGII